MEELLKEVVLSERKKRQMDTFIQTVTKLLQAVPQSSEVQVCLGLEYLIIDACFKFICLPPSQPEAELHLELLCVQVSDLSWLSGAAKVPFLLVPKATKGKFHMAPPASIDLIGSYPLGTCTKPRVVVDLAVTIPAVSPSPAVRGVL